MMRIKLDDIYIIIIICTIYKNDDDGSQFKCGIFLLWQRWLDWDGKIQSSLILNIQLWIKYLMHFDCASSVNLDEYTILQWNEKWSQAIFQVELKNVSVNTNINILQNFYIHHHKNLHHNYFCLFRLHLQLFRQHWNFIDIFVLFAFLSAEHIRIIIII